MSFKDLEVVQVHDELAKLIANYPERKGSLSGAEGHSYCVYYTNGSGQIVSSTEDEALAHDVTSLVTPICIVGQWVEDFHPELKQDETFQLVLLKNDTIGASAEAEEVLNEDVLDLLKEVQEQQDRGRLWGDIDL